MPRPATVTTVTFLAMALAGVHAGLGQPFPSGGSPNPAMVAAPAGPAVKPPVAGDALPSPTAGPPPTQVAAPALVPPPTLLPPPGSMPRAVAVARATQIPDCTMFVDAAAASGGAGTVREPHKTIAAAAAAAGPGAVICVAEGVYAETIRPGEKPFTLAGGFQRGKDFKVRDSAAHVSKAMGSGGGSFILIEDPGPKGEQLTAIDGFEITGYSQAILRSFYEPQRFDITNNFIHDNTCSAPDLVGAGFSLTNISGTIRGNVIRRNSCGRGGAGAYVDEVNTGKLLIAGNLVEENAGTQPDSSHGGGLYLFGKELTITGNAFIGNSVTQWGGGLYIGAFTPGNLFTNATMRWNVYRGNRAGNSGGGYFCDDGAACISQHEIYAGNCGGNILLDGGQDDSGPSVATFDHITNVGALDVGCKAPGIGVQISKDNKSPHTYSFTNAIFWGNDTGRDFAAFCDKACDSITVTVTHAMVQTEHAKQNMSVTFGAGIVTPSDPLFADPESGDFHLRSTAGRWTFTGYAADSASSPALGKGAGSGDESPERAGAPVELGAYGNSAEASYAR